MAGLDRICRFVRDRGDRTVLLPVLLLIAGVILWLLPRVSWYLAVDQFGYLTFARDLSHGRVSHPWPLLPLLDSFLPAGRQVDVLAQTYFWRDGALYSRYAPGFPLLIALGAQWTGWDTVFSYPPIFLGAFLLVFYLLARRLLQSTGLALSSTALLILLPTQYLLWAVSPLRDLPAHLFGAGALLTLLWPSGGAGVESGGSERPSLGIGRGALAGLLFGYAVCVRPDALLYAFPFAACLALARSASRRSLLSLVLGAVVGLLPVLAYNTVAQGNPLRPSQSMELNEILALSYKEISGRAEAGAGVDAREEKSSSDSAPRSQEGPGSGGAMAGSGLGFANAIGRIFGGSSAFAATGASDGPSHRYLQGGGLRISHLTSTLPGNLALFARVFGLSGCLLGLWGAIVARRRPLLFWVTVPYIVAATVFFGMWPGSDPRYLTGAFAFFTLLVLAGGRDLTGPGRSVLAGWGGLGLLLALGGWSGQLPFFAHDTRAWALAALLASLATSLGLRMARPGANSRASFAVVLALALLLLAAIRLTATSDAKASFGKREVARAVENLEAAAGSKSVVFTSTELGRPAENINYYTGATALYLDDLARWNVAPAWVIDQVLGEGFEVYLLLPEAAATQWMTSRFIYPWFSSSIEEEIAPGEAGRWFVATRGRTPPDVWWVRLEKRPEPLAPPDGDSDPPQF